MTVDRFLPGAFPATQSQQPQGKGRTPLLPSVGRAKKKQGIDNQSPRIPNDAPSKTPPRPSSEIVIWELVGDSRPTAQVEIDVASFSRLEIHWQPTFKFGDGPLLATASIRTWDKGQWGGWPRVCYTVCFCSRMCSSSRTETRIH